jgi:hypothetical protein
VASTISVAEAVLPLLPFSDVTADAGPVGAGVAVGEGLGTGVRVAEDRDVAVGLGVPPPPPPQPAKENTTRDKQINERGPEAQRRIDYLSAILRWTALGMQSWIIINYPRMSIGLIDKFLFSGSIFNIQDPCLVVQYLELRTLKE